MKNQVIQGDCLTKLKTLDENSVDSIVTDPPYHLVSIVKRFGGANSHNTPAMETKEGGVFARKAKGFMGKEWDGLGEDGIGIANNPLMWAECLRVLKPGGYLLSFGGSRTYHRMAVAIEDAGFEVRDMIEWVYGSGFPKSLNIGKAVDKLQGNEREYVGKNPDARPNSEALNIILSGAVSHPDITKGTSEWEGWGTALKPAHEPICMARKPLAEKTVAENVLKYGTGGINIDESRVGTEERNNPQAGFVRRGRTDEEVFGGVDKNKPDGELTVTGRFPANLIHDNSEEVRECFPETKSGGGDRNSKGKTDLFTGFGDTGVERPFQANEGNASRFFKSIIYQAKASKSGRGEGNSHPTVKPIALMEYLIKMVTPQGGIVLDPFAGSGSTLVAAKQNGYEYIGIELTPEYIDIINARLK